MKLVAEGDLYQYHQDGHTRRAGFPEREPANQASALTYSTLLSIVPLLAVLLGIAKGFGFQGTVRQELFDYFPGHEMELNKAFEFVESYLAQAQGGVIIGVGLILLFIR